MNDSLKNAYQALNEVLDQISLDKLHEIVKEVDSLATCSPLIHPSSLTEHVEKN